jgi:hypothetical protein
LDEKKGAISEFGEGTEITDNGIASNPGSSKGSNIGEELPIVMVETSEIDKVKHLSRDGMSLTGGDESSSRNDFMDLDDEDIISQWESKRGNKRTEKKSRATLKPLELAEQIEKKHAFSGLDMENDIAAQPMRLEGVRRVLLPWDTSMFMQTTLSLGLSLLRRSGGIRDPLKSWRFISTILQWECLKG